jgi:hypothetical protein
MDEHFVWFEGTYPKGVAGKCGFSVLNAKCGPLKNAKMVFPGDMFVPTASQMYQIEI